METDGRIRSKNIGTGEINSRTLDNIRSSNYDGSHDDPEGNPGTEGWQILKNGISVFNNAIIRGTLKAGQIVSGTLNIGSGGSITVGDEEDPEVRLDETGLSVRGGLSAPIYQNHITTNDHSLTTSFTSVHSVNVTIPAWVETIYIVASHRVSVSDTVQRDAWSELRVDGVTYAPTTKAYLSGVSQDLLGNSSATRTISIPPTGSPINIEQRGFTGSGTNNTNRFDMSLLVTGFGHDT